MKTRLTMLLLALLVSATAFAKPPMMEFYWVKYGGGNCLELAGNALLKSGFKPKSGTFKGEDRVAVIGDYKGAVSCPKNMAAAFVVVAGPNYKEANRLALQIKKNFK